MAMSKISPQVNSPQERIEMYLVNAEHYYKNSQETLKKKEFGKAGELLWGAIAESIKALYMIETGKPMNSHNQIRDFLLRLSTLYNNEVLNKWGRSANNLHVNFYETYLDNNTFLEYYDDGVQLLALIQSKLIKKKKSKK